MELQCPGKERAISAKDLTPKQFRRLVDRRARKVINSQLPLVTNVKQRRKVETQINDFFEKIHQGADFSNNARPALL